MKKIKPDQMKDAYDILFNIENLLKILVFSNYRNFEDITFFELVVKIHNSPAISLFLTHSILKQLSEIKRIRNKVCHMTLITEKEYQTIQVFEKELQSVLRKRKWKPIKMIAKA